MSLNQRKSNRSPRERPLVSQTLAWSHHGLRQLDSDQLQGHNLALGLLLKSLRARPEMVHLIDPSSLRVGSEKVEFGSMAPWYGALSGQNG